MKVLCAFGQYNYGEPSRGEGYEYSNFIKTLQELGHEVFFLDTWTRRYFQNFRELNEALLRKVEQVSPDVIFSVLRLYEIWLETWEMLRDAGTTATVNWATDDSWKYSQFSRLLVPAFHAFTTTYPDALARYHRDGYHNVLLTQWAANASILRPPLPANQCVYSVSFVGSAYGKRRAWIDALRRRGINVACFGFGWPAGAVPATQIPEIIRNSLVSLNFANAVWSWDGLLPRQINQIKARTFEVPGAGGFLLTEWAEGLDRYYVPQHEIAVFHNFDELVGAIHHYLASPEKRDEIAYAGYERTKREHTYDQRLDEVLRFTLAQRNAYFPSTAPSRRLDWPKFEAAARHNVASRTSLLLRGALVASGTALWGPKRGPRAARRLLFELSWRLAGASTYSARGLPGRLFYHES